VSTCFLLPVVHVQLIEVMNPTPCCCCVNCIAAGRVDVTILMSLSTALSLRDHMQQDVVALRLQRHLKSRPRSTDAFTLQKIDYVGSCKTVLLHVQLECDRRSAFRHTLPSACSSPPILWFPGC
jgi:hypothetical protein